LRAILTTCAAVLAVLAIVLGVVHFAVRPTNFKVAVLASDTLDQRMFGSAADMLRTARAPVRLEVVVTENAKAATEALDGGKVQLAVVRSDAALQGKAHTVLILRREAAVLIAPKTSKLQKVTDLPNSTLGITRDGPLDGSLLWPVLDYYGIARDKAKYVAVPTDDVANAVRTKKVDAVLVVGSLLSKQFGDLVAETARGAKGAINFVDIEESDAIAKRIPALESIEVDQGTFGGRPPRPADSFNTLGFSIRLVATAKSDTDKVAELIKQLYLIRQNLNAAIPGAGLMETPDLDEATAFLIHPGTRAYVNGDQKTLFDRYNDWIYFGAFIMSGLGSVAAGLFGWLGGRREDAPLAQEKKMEAALDAVRDAPDAEALDRVEREADEVFRSVFAHGVKDELSAASIASFDLALRELRSRIAARRAALAG
jgi:TRAP-type uncharacterized transport system substrate-binding protein